MPKSSQIIPKLSPNHPQTTSKPPPNHPKPPPNHPQTIPKPSPNQLLLSKKDHPKPAKSQTYFGNIGFLTFSACFVVKTTPKVDKIVMKVYIFIDFRQKMTYFWSNRSQKHGFLLKNRFDLPPLRHYLHCLHYLHYSHYLHYLHYLHYVH